MADGLQLRNDLLGNYKCVSTVSIDSRGRIDGSNSTTDYICNLKRGYNSVRAIRIQSAEIPTSWYTINSKNNQLIVSESSDYTITIPPGNYEPVSFTTVLANLLNTNSVDTLTYSVLYYPNTNKLHISATGNFAFAFTNVNSPYIAMGGVYNTTSVSGTIWESTNSIDLSVANRSVFILLNTPNTNDSLAGTFNFKIPLNVDAFQTCIYTNNCDWDQVNYFGVGGAIALRTLYVQLVDYNGFIINNNGVEWSFTLTIYE